MIQPFFENVELERFPVFASDIHEERVVRDAEDAGGLGKVKVGYLVRMEVIPDWFWGK